MANEPGPGHNSGLNKATLKGFVDELNTALNERATINDRMAEIRASAKSMGYDPKAISRIVRNLRRGKDSVVEERTVEQLYEGLLGDPFDE